MPCSQAQVAKRAFVAILLALGRKYGLKFTVSRDSEDNALDNAYKRLAKKVFRDRKRLTSQVHISTK